MGRFALEGARFVFYLGLPYLALLSGAFAPRDAGLQGSPVSDLLLGWTPEAWARALGHAAALGAFTLVTLAALVWQIRRAQGYPPTALGVEHHSLAVSIREAVYAEAHWSFYRTWPMALLSDARWASLGGLALATFEALLAGQTDSGAGRLRLSDALLASLSATYFALSGGNMWLAMLVQLAVRAGLTGLAFAGRSAEARDDIIV